MSDYYSTIMRMRQERMGRERVNEMREIQEDYQAVREARDSAAERGDVESFEGNDDHLIELERRWHQLNPPRPPQTDPRLIAFMRENQGFLGKFGDRAVQAMNEAHNYMLRPRNSHITDNNPAYHGMGWNPQAVFTPQYFDRLKTLLEMHGEQFLGVRYDPNEQSLTATEAAKISGLSPQAYNNSVHSLHRAGRLGIYRK